MKQLVLASNNAGKLREFNEMFAPLGIEIVPQAQFGVPEAEEPFSTFVENALAKARHAARLTGKSALADDSGICVNALGGRPGVLSARFAGEPKSDARNNEHLIRMLQGENDRSAFYYCVIVVVFDENHPTPVIAEGRWDGVIIDEPRGDGGFGYDPHFLCPDIGLTAAEMDSGLKNLLSHRGEAVRNLQKLIRDPD